MTENVSEWIGAVECFRKDMMKKIFIQSQSIKPEYGGNFNWD